LTLLVPAAARAQQTVLVESTTGRDAAAVDASLPEVVRALGTPAPRSGPSLAVDIELKFGAAPRRLPPSALAAIGEQLERVEQDLFYHGTRERSAVEALEEIRGRLARASGTLAHDAAARALYRRVLLSLIRAYHSTLMADAAAELLMKELVLSFPDLPVDAVKDGRVLFELFQRVQKSAPKEGVLRVELDGGPATVYLNERALDGTRAAVPAGEYRVFVSTPGGDGRLHLVPVGAGVVVLRVDVPFEVALEAEERVGFRYADAAARARDERRFVAKLGTALAADRMLVLGALPVDGQPAVGVISYALPDAAITDAVAVRGAPGQLAPGALARAVEQLGAPAHAGDGVVHLGAAALAPAASSPSLTAAAALPPARVERPASTARILAWSGLGLGLTLAVLGVHAAALDGTGTCGATSRLCSSVYNTDGIGAATWAVGGFGALLASTLLIAADEPRRLRTVALVTAAWGAAALVGGALLLADGDYPLAYQRDASGRLVGRTTDTGDLGVAALALGGAHLLAGAVMGLVDALHARAPLHAAPLVSPTATGLAVAGRF
jgi:hypothetical protein